MSSPPYTAPKLDATAFNCPRCNAYASQVWSILKAHSFTQYYIVDGLQISHCTHCGEDSVWLDEKILHPAKSTAPLPHVDLPAPIKADYEEARSIAVLSPRGAAALLRLAIQKLCASIGGTGKNINEDIAALVAKGLPEQIQQALDVVRVIGNEAVHPGTLDLKDDTSTVGMLFELVNVITDRMISGPKRIAEMYKKLPPEKLKQIQQRDTPKQIAAPAQQIPSPKKS